jgi:hypothetical protein
MDRTIIAFYDNFHIANGAVRELVEYGFTRDDISVVANSANGAYGYMERPMNTGVVLTGYLPDERRAGARIGAGIGAAIGMVSGLLAGSGAWLVPGFEPAAAAGFSSFILFVLASWAAGSITGGIAGRILGSVIGLGIPEEEAEQYADSVRQSGVLVAVKADNFNGSLIYDVLSRYHPSELYDKTPQQHEPVWRNIRASRQPVYAREWENAHRQ